MSGRQDAAGRTAGRCGAARLAAAAGLAAAVLLGAATPLRAQAPTPADSTAADDTIASDGPGRSAFDRLHDLLDTGTSGVDVRRSSGSLGAAPSLRLRAPSTLDPGAEPLVYVDGARVVDDNATAFGFFVGGQEPSRLTDLPLEDVATVTVLKGPAATALYGTGASAGVLLVTTRRGEPGEPTRWTLGTEQGATWDPTAWWSLAWNPIRSSVHVPGAKDTTYVQSLLEGTRFGDPFRTGHLQAYRVSVRGGSRGLSHYLSGGALDGEGNLPANGRERLNARANASLEPSPELQLSVSTGYVDGRVRLPENDDNLFGMVGNALGSPWWGPTTARDPNRAGVPIETCFIMLEFARATGDPLAERSRSCAPANPFFLTTFGKIATIVNRDDVARFTGSAAARWRSSPALLHRVTIGFDRSDAVQTEVVPVDPARPFGADSEGRIDRAEIDESRVTLEASSTLATALSAVLSSRTTLGLQWHEATRDLDFAIGRRFPAGDPSLEASEVLLARKSATASARTLGVVLQQRLAWRDRLFLSAGARLDDDTGVEVGGARLDPQLRASWRVSEEAWWPDPAVGVRLRAAWGRSARGPDLDDAFAPLAPVPGAEGEAPDVLEPPFGAGGLRPERVTEWEAGLDLAAPDGRLDLTLTVYGRRATDVLTPPRSVSSPEGPDPGVNAATIAGSGVEAGLDVFLAQRAGLRWVARLTLTATEDEIVELPEPIAFRESAQAHREGFPVGGYFGRPVTVDANGEAAVGGETFLGTPTPEREGSLSTELRLFDRVRLFARADYAGGHVLHDLREDFACRLMGGGRDAAGRLRGACTAIFAVDPRTGRPTEEALRKIEASRVGTAAPYVYPADHLRLRTASVRFELPGRWLAALGGLARSASVTVVGENLGLWTRYPGTDPEVSESGPSPVLRQQLWGVPPDRRVSASLALSF